MASFGASPPRLVLAGRSSRFFTTLLDQATNLKRSMGGTMSEGQVQSARDAPKRDEAYIGKGISLRGVPEPVRAAYTAPPTAWDAESAAEAGRRSGEARRRRREMSPEERVRDSISKQSDNLVAELINAALGQGDFIDLKLETRVTAITRLLEWQLGRPASVKPKEEPDAPAVPASGEDLFEK